jgi:dCMP deaminase
VIYNATYNGISLDGATLYVSGLPVCSSCALGVIQVGIKRVVMPKMEYKAEWMDNFQTGSKYMFDEAGVEWEFIDVSKG